MLSQNPSQSHWNHHSQAGPYLPSGSPILKKEGKRNYVFAVL
jgi:hypothetical protein